MINETNVNCFLSVAETKNFTESARRLFLTQQAVSKNVMQLEMDVGFNLIDRSSRSVLLTPEGEKFRQVLLQIISYYRNEVNMIKMLLQSQERNIRICCQNFLDLGAGIKRVVEQAKEADPGLSITVNRFPPGELIRRLDDGETDIILIYERYAPKGSGYLINTLFSTRTSVLVSSNHPLVKDDTTYLDLKSEPYIIDSFPGESEAAVRQRAKRESNYAGITPSKCITVPNRESAYNTAALGMGIVLGTEISQIPPGFDLVRCRTDTDENICCVCRNNPSSYISDMLERLISEYRN